MQYKTIPVEHDTSLKNSGITRLSAEINSEYQSIINHQAEQGWKLLGIHPISIRKERGCLVRYFRLLFLKPLSDEVQVDVLVFFHE